MSSKYGIGKIAIRYYELSYGYVGNVWLIEKVSGIERYSEASKEKTKG
jgi:hypothetical protein